MAYQVHDIEGARAETRKLAALIEEGTVTASKISGIVADLESVKATAGLAEQVHPKFNGIADAFKLMGEQYTEADKILQTFINANEEIDNFSIGDELSKRLNS